MSVKDFHVAVVLVIITGYIPGEPCPPRPSSKPRLGKTQICQNTNLCPGVFSKLKLFVIIMRIIIDFYRLSLLFSVMFFGFFFFKKKKVGVLLID